MYITATNYPIYQNESTESVTKTCFHACANPLPKLSDLMLGKAKSQSAYCDATLEPQFYIAKLGKGHPSCQTT